MKRIVAMVCMVMLWTSIGFAEEQWEPIESKGESQNYISTSSIKVFTVGTEEIAKAKVKLVYGDVYTINYYKVNLDTKASVLYQFENFKDGKITRQYVLGDRFWEDYDPNNVIINEILKRAN